MNITGLLYNDTINISASINLIKERCPDFVFEGDPAKVDNKTLLWNASEIANCLPTIESIGFLEQAVQVASYYASRKTPDEI